MGSNRTCKLCKAAIKHDSVSQFLCCGCWDAVGRAVGTAATAAHNATEHLRREGFAHAAFLVQCQYVVSHRIGRNVFLEGKRKIGGPIVFEWMF